MMFVRHLLTSSSTVLCLESLEVGFALDDFRKHFKESEKVVEGL